MILWRPQRWIRTSDSTLSASLSNDIKSDSIESDKLRLSSWNDNLFGGLMAEGSSGNEDTDENLQSVGVLRPSVTRKFGVEAWWGTKAWKFFCPSWDPRRWGVGIFEPLVTWSGIGTARVIPNLGIGILELMVSELSWLLCLRRAWVVTVLLLLIVESEIYRFYCLDHNCIKRPASVYRPLGCMLRACPLNKGLL